MMIAVADATIEVARLVRAVRTGPAAKIAAVAAKK